MDFEILVTLTAIVFGSLTIIAIVAMITGVIRYWIRERHQGSKVIRDEAFLIALKEFKEKTDRRLAVLESLIAAPADEEAAAGTGMKSDAGSNGDPGSTADAAASRKGSPAAHQAAAPSASQDGGSGDPQRLKNMLS